MNKRVISVDLSSQGITQAIKELNDWRDWLLQKTDELLKELAEEGVEIASAHFANAVYDGYSDVTVHWEDRDDHTVAVVGFGKTVLMLEFGSGVKFPDNHPEAGPANTLHGSWSESEYGKGHWDNPKGWFYAHGRRSYGNPANKCMYRTKSDLKNQFEQIARRVFV